MKIIFDIIGGHSWLWGCLLRWWWWLWSQAHLLHDSGAKWMSVFYPFSTCFTAFLYNCVAGDWNKMSQKRGLNTGYVRWARNASGCCGGCGRAGQPGHRCAIPDTAGPSPPFIRELWIHCWLGWWLDDDYYNGPKWIFTSAVNDSSVKLYNQDTMLYRRWPHSK